MEIGLYEGVVIVIEVVSDVSSSVTVVISFVSDI